MCTATQLTLPRHPCITAFTPGESGAGGGGAGAPSSVVRGHSAAMTALHATVSAPATPRGHRERHSPPPDRDTHLVTGSDTISAPWGYVSPRRIVNDWDPSLLPGSLPLPTRHEVEAAIQATRAERASRDRCPHLPDSLGKLGHLITST